MQEGRANAMDHERYVSRLPKPSEVSTRTVLEPLRPNVVVRRRIVTVAARVPVDPPPSSERADERDGQDEQEDEAPPSSIFVHPDYEWSAGARASDPDEDDETEERPAATPEASPEPPPPSLRPNVTVGPDATLASVAKELGFAPAELAADLMARGFFSVTPRTRLSEELVRVLAQVFRCKISRVSPPARPARAKAKNEKPVRPSRPAKRAATKKRSASRTKAKSTSR